MSNPHPYPWAEKFSPKLLKSPWWIGHIPFSAELIGRLRPTVLVELGTYSGSSFAAFCQAVKEFGLPTQCYGVDLWQGDVHMGSFEEDLYQEILGYMQDNYPSSAHLIRKNFNEAVHDFADHSIDLLHIDGTHTFEAVSNDFNTWLPKLSDRAVVMFHDINVTEENTGPSSKGFGVKQVFDGLKVTYPHLEFEHCWGLGVLLVGKQVPAEVVALTEAEQKSQLLNYFSTQGKVVSDQFAAMEIELPKHGIFVEANGQRSAGALDFTSHKLLGQLWQRTTNKINRLVHRYR